MLRKTGRGEGLWTQQEGISSCLVLAGQEVLGDVEQASSTLSYPKGSLGPRGKEFRKSGIALGAPPRAKQNPYLVSPIISGWCWAPEKQMAKVAGLEVSAVPFGREREGGRQ
jgi:hypothetical protein